MCVLDGWIFSSLPLAIRADDGPLRVNRLRQTVSPTGELSEEVDITSLDPLPPSTLEAEAAEGHWGEALKLASEAGDAAPGDFEALEMVAVAHRRLGHASSRRGDLV